MRQKEEQEGSQKELAIDKEEIREKNRKIHITIVEMVSKIAGWN